MYKYSDYLSLIQRHFFNRYRPMHNDGHKLLRAFSNVSLDDFTVSNDINHIIGKLILPVHISTSVLLQRVFDGQKVLLLVFVIECL